MMLANSVYRSEAELQDTRVEEFRRLSDSGIPELAEHRLRTDRRGHADWV